MRLTLAIFLLALIPCTVVAAPRKTGSELVSAKLVADVASIEPGKPFTVGVMLMIDPGWHVYWVNPGDAGMATSVKFDLPDGFTAGELQFPIPERIVDPGDIVVYGYENQVMLLATITPPTDLKPGQSIKLSAKAEWLVCEKICLAGDGEIAIELPVSEKSSPAPSPANAELFEKWYRQIPTPGAAPSVTVSSSLDFSKGESAVDVFTTDRIEQTFPGPLDGATVIISEAKKLPRGFVTVVRVTPLPGQTISAKFLEVLFVYESNGEQKGAWRAYDVKIPIAGSKQK